MVVVQYGGEQLAFWPISYFKCKVRRRRICNALLLWLLYFNRTAPAPCRSLREVAQQDFWTALLYNTDNATVKL